MSYIGNQPTTTAFVTDTFNGTGSTTAFTMSVAPASTTSVLVAVTGVLQDPSTYSVSGTTLTFSAAPPSGTGNISVRYLGIPASGVTTTAYRTVTEFTATAGQTSFSVPSYTVGYIDVYRNGVMLGTADFTATTGTTVVLAVGATVGDLIRTESFYVSSVLNAIPATAGAVNSTYIADTAVTTAKIADSNVTPGKLDTQAQYTGFKNRIINGAMMIDQRNAGASSAYASGSFIVDRFRYYSTQASKFTLGQNLNSVTPPAGFTNYLGAQVASAVSVGSSDFFFLQHIIEGYNFADMSWGTANAKPVTLSFQVYSSLTGTFGGALVSYSAPTFRSYPFTYTVSSANTWTSISVTVPGDSAWVGNATNGEALRVDFGLGVGPTYSGPAGAWATANYVTATGATSVVGTSGATFYITGVQLEKGSTATSFDYRPYGTELALCQRYYTTQSFSVNQWVNSGTGCRAMFYVPVQMRATPTYALSNETKSGVSTTFIESSYVTAASGYFLGTTAGAAGGWSGTLTATAEL